MTIYGPGPEVISFLSDPAQLSMQFVQLINLRLLTVAIFFSLNIAEYENSLLIHMKKSQLLLALSYLLAEKFHAQLS